MAWQGTFLQVPDKASYHIEFIIIIEQHKKQAEVKKGYRRGV
jgi:hypothetical protein